MSPRPRTVADDVVLDAAARVIGRRGVGRLRLADVAAEAGLAAATLVQRFGSKRGLLLAVAKRSPDHARQVFAAARARSADPLGALRDGLVALAPGARTREEVAHHLSFLQLDVSDPELREPSAALGRAVLEEVRSLLREAAARGEVGGDPARLAWAVYTMYHGVLSAWALHGVGPLDGAIRAAIAAVLEPYAQS